MQNAVPVQLRQVRDFGQIITDTFQFLKQNRGPLFRAIAVICLPIGLIAGFLMGKTVGDIQSLAFGMGAGDPDTMLRGLITNFIPMIIGYLLVIVAYVLLISVVHEYIRAYSLGEHHMITTKDLWDRARGQAGTYFGTGFLSGLLIMVGFILCILPGFYPLTVLSLVFICHAIERTGATGSMARSNNLVKDRFWETLGLILIIGLINMVISYVIMLPFTIVGFVVGFNNVLGAVDGSGGGVTWLGTFTAIQMAVQMAVGMLIHPISSVAMGLKYFTLVEEKEGAGLRQKLEGFEQA